MQDGAPSSAAPTWWIEPRTSRPINVPSARTRALWRPRLLKALEWVALRIAEDPARAPVKFEQWGEMREQGVRIFGKIDRLDRLENGALAIVDYKTGKPPSWKQVDRGFALQLGTLGLMAERGAFGVEGAAEAFEYWSLGSNSASETGFGYIATPLHVAGKRSGIPPEEFLPQARAHLDDALRRWISGDEPFTARLNPDADVYNSYDQLMRLDEWIGSLG